MFSKSRESFKEVFSLGHLDRDWGEQEGRGPGWRVRGGPFTTGPAQPVLHQLHAPDYTRGHLMSSRDHGSSDQESGTLSRVRTQDGCNANL